VVAPESQVADVVAQEAGRVNVVRSLRRYAEETWVPPFQQPLPSNIDQYAAQVSWRRAAWRRALRQLKLTWHGQASLVCSRIDLQRHRRVLWIHQGTPQVGDSLMDLAARVLLKGRIDRLDLLTEPHLLPLYRSDEVFTQVGSSPAELAGSYDLILLHSTSSRSVRDKLAHYTNVPFAHVQGYFTGPEFNRTLFGFYRLAQLLRLPLDEAEINRIARPSMRAAAADERAVDSLQIPAGALLLALGGVRDWRTYEQWPQVLKDLHASGVTAPVVLVGAENGLPMRDAILSASTGLRIIDRVAQHSLGEVHAMMRRCALALCADGGLLHVAHAADVPTVALFAGIIDPSYRVTAANRTRSLYGERSVNDVPAAKVAACALAMLSDGQAAPL
jgi:Glycosyltransferase family 9 (heptosyltransferase)